MLRFSCQIAGRVSAVALALLALAGCVERTITITSEPDAALVYLNDEEVGRTPLTVPFTFYGVYDVRLEHDGCRPLWTKKKAQAPWWETIGPDLVAEMIPGNKAEQRWHFKLEPSPPDDVDALFHRATRQPAGAVSYDPGMNAPATNRPKHLDLKKDRGLTVHWQDGATSFYPVAHLRRMSPSADAKLLRAEMARNPLTVLPASAVSSGQQPLTAVGAELVGNYAVRIIFSDGHDTGIYSWDYLRQIDPANPPPCLQDARDATLGGA
jgi:DUF971 family protein